MGAQESQENEGATVTLEMQCGRNSLKVPPRTDCSVSVSRKAPLKSILAT